MNRALSAVFASIGRPTLVVVEEARGLASVAGQVIAAIARGEIDWREVVHQAYLIGNKSLAFVTVTLGFLGLITVYQVALQIKQIIPDYTMLGPAFLQMMIREFSPTITGLMIATRVGSGIAAEIGSMTVTEQVDALRMCNADPVTYLITPRFVACTVMSVCLTLYGAVVGVLAGSLIAIGLWDIPADVFFRLNVVSSADLVSGLMKAVAYGMAIPIVAGHAGFATHGGSEGVGEATTRAVVNASFAVVVLDLLISGFSYLVLFK